MYQTMLRPRVSETDGAGHINNTTLPVWFEAGREPIFKLFTPDDSFKNWRCVILNSNIDYLAQIYYGTEVLITTALSKIGRTSFTLYEELYQGNVLCAKSKAVYVNFNFETQQTEEIPLAIRVELEKHLAEQDETKPSS